MAAAELELRRRRAAQEVIAKRFVPYGEWLSEFESSLNSTFRWDARHFRLMQQTLDQVTRGEVKRALFNVAVRHGKTEHNTIRYTVYRLERDPTTRVLIGTYSFEQAKKLSRSIRRLLKARGKVAVSKDKDSVGEWETAAGGGVRCVGVGSGLASVNADLIIIDDPIGKRADAESLAIRDSTWDWITSDVLARAEPKTGVLFSMPRWHQDDPAGRMREKQKGRWTVIDLPGVAEPDVYENGQLVYHDPLDREPGELLWPEERDQEWMDGALIDLLEYGFASLVQGRPKPREGGMFKWDWWQLMDTIPAQQPMVRYWDLAGTEPTKKGHDPDFTAGALATRTHADPAMAKTVIVHVERFRKAVHERDALIEALARRDQKRFGLRLTYWFEKDPGISGNERTEAIMRRIQNLGITCYCEVPTGKKEIRAEPLASQAGAGNVFLGPETPEDPWRDRFRSEAASFPGGKHDDQVDAAVGAVSKLVGAQATVSTYAARI